MSGPIKHATGPRQDHGGQRAVRHDVIPLDPLPFVGESDGSNEPNRYSIEAAPKAGLIGDAARFAPRPGYCSRPDHYGVPE